MCFNNIFTSKKVMLCPWVPDVLRLVGVSAPKVNAAVGVRGKGDRVLCRIPVLVGKMPGVNGGAKKWKQIFM
jgi:hypothetical protein